MTTRKTTRKRGPLVPSRREKQTLIPSFDANDLAREIESTPVPTAVSPFDPGSYARIALPDSTLEDEGRLATEREAVAIAADAYDDDGREPHDTLRAPPNMETSETMGRSMYGSYLESDYPAALAVAEKLLDREPDHKLAQLVLERCHAHLSRSDVARVHPSSVLRLKAQPDATLGLEIELGAAFLLEHLDGVSDAATVAELTGLPRDEAIDRLHELLDLGLVEVVSA